MIYTYSETYAGIPISVEVYTKSGTVTTPNGTVSTHTVKGLNSANVLFTDPNATDETLSATIASTLAALKADVDGIDDIPLHNLLTGLGFTV
jgi:hypothetical protein